MEINIYSINFKTCTCHNLHGYLPMCIDNGPFKIFLFISFYVYSTEESECIQFKVGGVPMWR